MFAEIHTFIWRNHSSTTTGASSPIAVLEEWEKKSKAMAKKGLKIGLADMLSGVVREMPEEDKLLLHKKLVDEGFTGLWPLIAIVNNVPVKVLKRGKINNLDEWYVISDMLAATDSIITEEDRVKLGELSAEFEDRQRRMGR